ncbi:MAG: RNA methyltransferase [Proteobacteria bacterium]|nr:RNA methyltransferase [Pseudomonadota bacterium]MBU1648310.1 RNA methyltransferase [Pseudomonadota bacterium]MBU1986753.1 RNA methyltransferase [Pseudomonadota bacterium]
MNEEREKVVDIALIHYPVINKRGETIGSAVTNLDLHDIARAARTYGIDNYYIVTPYSDQQILVQEILDHWQSGYGATYNPARKAALDRVKITGSLETAICLITEQRGRRPLILTTSARAQKNSISYRETRRRIETGEPIILLFGTAHGLAPEITETADYTLPPIESATDYNHLSVRSAVSIILDRLLGVQEEL